MVKMWLGMEPKKGSEPLLAHSFVDLLVDQGLPVSYRLSSGLGVYGLP